MKWIANLKLVFGDGVNVLHVTICLVNSGIYEVDLEM